MKKSLLLIIVLVINGLNVLAEETKEKETRAFQLSFITPAGTNGIGSWKVTNSFSLNLLAGYAGGVNGAEFSGLTSVLRDDMKGAQFSGLGSVVLGEVKGAQFAGLFNIVNQKVKGAQFAGLANIDADTVNGFQAAGLVNLSVGGDVTQAAGLVNVNAGNERGMQIAGLGNVNSGSIKGVQLAGLFNYAHKVEGVQLGVFNFADSIPRGVPIGFLSFVANGYYAVEVAFTETFYGTVSFKTGTRQFYNILSTGVASRNDKVIWGWGYGVGTLVPVTQKVDIGFELLTYHVNEGEWFTQRLNLLNRLNVFASWNVAPHVTLFGGPSWNVTVTDTYDGEGGVIEPSIAPWTVFDKTYTNDINITMYPGFSAGIRF